MPHIESWEEEFDIVLNSWVRSGMKNTDPVKQAVRNLRTQEREKTVLKGERLRIIMQIREEEREKLIKIAEGMNNYYGNPKGEKMIYLSEIIAEVRKNK